MTTLNIRDTEPATGVVAFDLQDLLRLIGPDAVTATWTVQSVECIGPRAADLQSCSDEQGTMSGAELLEIAAGIHQVIDGYFVGYRNLSDEPWIALRAIDSTSWDVSSDDNTLLDRFRNHFRRVAEISAENPWQ